MTQTEPVVEFLPSGLVSLQQFERVFEAVSNWGLWSGASSRLGTTNFADESATRRGFASVAAWRTVGLSRPMPTKPGPSNSRPVSHTYYPSADFRVGDEVTYTFHKDFVALCPHGGALTHLDALSHMQWRGRFFDGLTSGEPDDPVTGVDQLASGLVTRGVLLDVARVRQVDWLDPTDVQGRAITEEDLDAAEVLSGASLQPGDVALVRTGRWARASALGDWSHSEAQVGLHPGAMPWFARRKIAMLGMDTTQEIYPSVVEHVTYPVHILALVSMGMPLIDNLDLEGCTQVAQSLAQGHFLFMLSALPIPGGTGCPVNPIVIF